MGRVYCVKCRKLGLITCICVASAMSVTGAPSDGSALSHAIGIAANPHDQRKCASIPDPVSAVGVPAFGD
jgi:hypothetical protein